MIIIEYRDTLFYLLFFQEKRLRSRKTDNEDSIRKRLEIADAEMEYGT